MATEPVEGLLQRGGVGEGCEGLAMTLRGFEHPGNDLAGWGRVGYGRGGVVGPPRHPLFLPVALWDPGDALGQTPLRKFVIMYRLAAPPPPPPAQAKFDQMQSEHNYQQITEVTALFFRERYSE